MQILLIKAGTTVSNVAKERGDFEDWFAEGLGVPLSTLYVCEVFRGAKLPNIESFAAVIVSGSASMVTDNTDWSLESEAWLADAVTSSVPILGVCYGHQLLARALGGVVQNNPAGRQIGTCDMHLTALGSQDPLLGQLPSVAHVPVSHSQVVSELPANARRLATSAADPNHAFTVNSRVWGVQFHPEFDAEIVRGYIDARQETIVAEGINAEAAYTNARDSADGRTLLRAFAAMAGVAS